MREQKGIVHINARNDRDAFFALGFVHAQERMWQMDYKRRLGQGRLSEILGVDALPTDKMMRTLGLRDAAQSALSGLAPGERAALGAYAAGVNAWIAAARELPPEYHVYGIRPEPWHEADSLLMIKLLALNLGSNFRNELANDVLIKHLGVQRARALTGQALPDDGGMVDSRLPALAAAFESAERLGGEGAGSNAWAVAGRFTANHLPLLASDPHLLQQMPSVFFLAELKGDRLHVSGATLAGVPVVVFGRNDRIAWGGTNLAADVQDLYAERPALGRDDRYEQDGQWRRFAVRDEFIRIAPAFPAMLREAYRPLHWRVRSTAHGPLVSDLVSQADQPLALRWTALDPDDGSFGSLLAVNYAQNLDQFKQALSGYVAPALNFIYADRDDNIAQVAAGRIPVRAKGNGTVPVPGWDSAYRWERYLRPDELPHAVNPPSGILVSANERPHGDDYPYILSNNWQPPYRARRIRALLEERLAHGGRVGPDDMAAIQLDVLDPQALALLPFLVGQRGRTDRQRAAIARLARWDGRMSLDSVGASIYHAWSRQLMRRLVRDPLVVDASRPGRYTVLSQQGDVFRPEFLGRIAHGELNDWCAGGPRAAHPCDEVAVAALDDAIEELRKLAGSDMDGWRWGSLHDSRYPHLSFAASAVLAPWFDRSQPAAGGRYSVNVGDGAYTPEHGYVKQLGAAYRQVIPLDADGGSFVIAGGQSGNLFDGHYADQLPMYEAGRLLPMRTVRAASNQVLSLQPQAAH